MAGIDYSIIAIFLCTIAVAGLAVSRLIHDSDDFFVAGRQLTPFVLAATITATNLSMFHFVGMGGIAYENGVSIIWQNWCGNMALVISGLFVLPLMRRLRVRSVPEYLEIRYSRGLRTLVGAFWGIRLCVYLGILLYIASTAAVIITGWDNYAGWLLVFSCVAILYSIVGGAWAVAIMDSVQFLVMLAGALVFFPIAMRAAGGLPDIIAYFKSIPAQAHFVQFVPQKGTFNWLWICALTLLGLKWATIDQAILQRAFGAKTPRVGAKGMVLSGVITTAMAFLWVLPGLAAAKLHPQAFAKPDHAIPWLLSTQLPLVAKGLLGFVLCGLVASQISVITADVNSVATLFTSDVYRTLRSREPTQRELLRVVRISSGISGTLMLLVAYGLKFTDAGAVKANLAVVGILDMPLFVVTVIYGMAWTRANWQGATAGFLAGGAVGLSCYGLIDPRIFSGYVLPSLAWLPSGVVAALNSAHGSVEGLKDNLLSIAPIASSATALLVTPIVSLLTPASATDRGRRAAEAASDTIADDSASPHEPIAVDERRPIVELPHDHDDFTFIPLSLPGRIGAAMAVIGFTVFVTGVLSGSVGASLAAPLAIGGLLTVLSGGVLRVYSR